MDTPNTYAEIQIGSGKRKGYVLVFKKDEKIWIDTKMLPQSAFICAMVDGISVKVATVAKRTKRRFLPLEWAINEWGGDPKFVEALKTRRQMTLDQMPHIRETYFLEEDE